MVKETEKYYPNLLIFFNIFKGVLFRPYLFLDKASQ